MIEDKLDKDEINKFLEEDSYISMDIYNYFEKKFYNWLKEGLKENPNLLIELVTANSDEMHMGLGLYIRNYYLHNKKVYKDVPNGHVPFWYCAFPDNYSGAIVDFWQDLAIRIQQAQTLYSGELNGLDM